MTDRLAHALTYAHDLHHDQTRKVRNVPYLAHLLGVAAILMEANADQDVVIAGLLHDALEDQPERTSLAEIEKRFGARVARIVHECTEDRTDGPQDWKSRKRAYLEHLQHAGDDAVLVSLADKTDNAWAMLHELEHAGPEILHAFNAPAPCQTWRYHALDRIFRARAGDTILYPRWREAWERVTMILETTQGNACTCHPPCA